jgi:hypothetical protein
VALEHVLDLASGNALHHLVHVHALHGLGGDLLPVAHDGDAVADLEDLFQAVEM